VEEPAIEETPVEEPSVETAADEKEADVMDVEEDSPLENWTVKELKEECKTLGLTDKGKKADLIERIREAQGKKSEATPVVEEIALESAADDVPVNEPATEEAVVDESVTEEPAVEEAPIEEAAVEKATEKEAAVEEIADEKASAEEMAIEAEEVIEKVEEEADGPLEDWTVKELKEECKTLGLTDKGKKAELIARITESRSSSQEAAVETVEEIAEKEVDEEVAAIEEAPVDEASVEDAPVEEAPVEEAPVEEAPVEEAPVEETPVEDTPVEESTIEETQAPAGEAAADETESQSAGLDPSSISELLAKNEQGQLSQQEFFRIFLVSVQNSLTTNQRLADVEKKLEETAERLEKVEVAADSVSNATTEPEADAPAVQPVSTEEPAVEESTEDPMEEADITSLVENAEKLQPRISRKRAQASGHQKKSARAKRARV